MDDDVAVAMRRSPIVDPHGVGRQYELHPVRKSLRGGTIVSGAGPPTRSVNQPRSCSGTSSSKLPPKNILTFASVSVTVAPPARGPQLVLERQHRLLVRDDRHIRKGDVAGDVVEMEMRIDERADRYLE